MEKCNGLTFVCFGYNEGFLSEFCMEVVDLAKERLIHRSGLCSIMQVRNIQFICVAQANCKVYYDYIL